MSDGIRDAFRSNSTFTGGACTCTNKDCPICNSSISLVEGGCMSAGGRTYHGSNCKCEEENNFIPGIKSKADLKKGVIIQCDKGVCEVDHTHTGYQLKVESGNKGGVAHTVVGKLELTEGTKYDDSKIPVELLPTQALEEVAKVLDFGRRKYASWNWAKGFKWTRLIGAAIRHLYAYQRGEDKDPESGLSHAAHCACCILFLLQHELSNLGEDDRYKEFIKK